jgi:bacterioferritin-associated ferredoxin
MLPWEFSLETKKGQVMDLVDSDGVFVESAPLVDIHYNKQKKTSLLTFRVNLETAASIAGVRVQEDAVSQGRPVKMPATDELDSIVCRCERITLGEIVTFIKENGVKDINQLKTLRVGMGACGGKTCSQLLSRAFKLAGVDMSEVEPASVRPLFMEVPMGEIVNEGLVRIGSADANQRGAP